MNIFTKHPSSVGETYWQHFAKASIFGLRLVVGGLVCLIHAVLPFLFEGTASNITHKLHAEFLERNPK